MTRHAAFFVALPLWLVLSTGAFAQNIPPGGWAGNVTIGAADVGDATGENGTFTVTGDGTDIQGTADHCQFLYKELVGDGSMSCRVVDVGTGSNAWCKGGIMVRQTTDAGSMGALMPITGGNGNGSSWQWRLTNDGGTSYTNSGPVVAPPYFVKIERVGDTFSGLYSPDGITWTQLGASQTIVMGETCLIGLAVTSHAGGELRTYTFDTLGFSGGVEGLADPGSASDPVPEDEDSDIIRDTLLTWSPGQYPGTHTLYFGSRFDDVNSATVPTASGLDTNAFDPGRLEFSQTYFWRVDEVNASPDKTVFKGDIWRFTVEPYSVMIPVDVNHVTASSSTEESTPGMIVNGSGLENGVHSTEQKDMWLSASGDLSPWLMVEFDQLQKLDKMVIWNANSKSEAFIGWGIKDVNIEFSTDGVDWTGPAESTQISRGPGQPGYDTPQTIDLGLTPAKYVRLNILSNWGGVLKQYSASEVQVYGLPVQARISDPASGSVDILPNVTATWRAGREAGQHTVYLSTDSNAVADGSAPSVASSTNSVALPEFGVQLNETYYWRVDEVNDTEAPPVWAGDVWNFSTVPYATVDDFESYGDYSPDRPFQTWLDGFGYSADEYFPVAYPGNGTGSGVGHDIWSPGSPYFDGSIMETARTMAGSDQSMPFYYSNTGVAASQIDRTFAAPQDWTLGGAKTLSIGILGQADNTGTLYVKINNTKKMFDGDISLNVWQPWEIDLASLGINLNGVTTLSLGVDGVGASGLIFIDEIRLYRVAPAPPETVSLVNDFDSLAVGASMQDVDGWEGWFGNAASAGKVTDTVSYSGTNALEIKGGRDDLVPHWPLADSGLYVASIMQYVPSSTTSGVMYFAPLRIYGSNWDETAWMKDFRTDCGTGLVFVNDLDVGSRTEATLIRDQWVQLRLVLNFDADTCDFYYGDVYLGTTECPSVQAFDIYPDDNVDVVYFDDFKFESQL